jgi:PAS domain S-box-containing protein
MYGHGESPRNPEGFNRSRLDADPMRLVSTIFFNLSTDLFAIAGTDGYFKRLNPAWTKILGWTNEQLMGRPWIESIHPEDRATIEGTLSERGPSKFSFEIRFQHQDESYRWLSWKGSQYPDGLTYIVARDITEKKQIEAALRQSERQYRSLVETSKDLIWSVDLDYRWTFVNQAVREIYGCDPSETIGRSFLERVPPEQQPKDLEVFEKITAGEPCLRYETEHRRADGTPVYLIYNAIAVYDETGRVIGTTGTATDITERKQAEAALRASQQKLAIHVERTPLAAIEWNLNFEVTDWNPAAELMFGYSRREALGRQALDLLVPEQAKPLVANVLQALIEQKGGTRSTNENLTKSGKTIVCEWYNTPLVDANGTIIGVASLVQDVTQRVAAVTALQQSESRFQKLAANVPGAIYQFLKRTDGSICYPFISFGCQDLLELAPKTIRNHPEAIVELIHREDRPSYEDSVAESARTLQPWTWEGRFITPSGKCKWLQFASRPEKHDNGDILWDGLVMDITDRKEAEAAVTQSEAKWRSLIQNSSDAIAILEADGTIRYASPSVEGILGFKVSQLVGRDFLTFVHPEDRDRVRHAYQKLCGDSRTTLQIEYRQQHANGAWLCMESVGCNLLDESAIGGLVVNSRDISERKLAEQALNQANADLERRVNARTAELRSSLEQLRVEIVERAHAEEALRASEQRFRAIFEDAAIGIAAIALDGRILDSNPALQEMLGYSAEQLREKTNEALTDPDDLAIESALRKEIVSGRRDYYQIEKRFLCREDRRIWVRLSVSLVRDGRGNPQFAIGMAEDITARKQAEAELILTRKAVESSSDAIAIADGDGRYLYQNAAFCQLFEYETPEQLNDAGGHDLLYQDPQLARDVFETVTQGRSWSGEVLGKSRGDRTIPTLLRADAIKDASGQIVGLSFTSTDISHRVHAEEKLKQALAAAETANRAKSAFLANMSHELRTPLNAIIGYSEFLCEEMEDLGYDDLIGDLDKIKTAGKHLLALINDILDISKIEAGRMTLYVEEFDLEVLIDEVFSTVHPAVEKKNNTLKLEYDPDAIPTMTADITKVRQILLNLLSNAAKFTENGTITLSVEKEAIAPDGEDREGFVIFSVKDNGIGMSPEQLDSIFQAFAQADASTTRKFGGTGLGLAISQRYCQMMGGHITCDSEFGQGSVFVVRLPLHLPTEA